MGSQDESFRTEALLQHAGWLQPLARSLVGDDAAAQDALQQAWLAALVRPPRSLAGAGAWLRTVLCRLASRTRREEARRLEREQRSARPERDSTTPEALLQRVELQRDIADAVTRLDEPYRSTVVLRFFQELSVAEIARQQGVPPTTAHSRLAKALKQLRLMLDRKYGGNRSAWCLILLPLVHVDESAAAAAAGSAAVPVSILMEGVAVKVLIKTSAAVVTVLVAGLLLNVAGVLPGPFSPSGGDETPLEVSFRPITERPAARAFSEPLSPSAEWEPIPGRVLPAEADADRLEHSSSTAWIEARIQDGAGRPLAGAQLREVTEKGGLPAADAGADGSVRLALDAGTGARGRGAHVEALLLGYASHVERVRLEAGRAIPLGTITLAPGGAIRGCVSDGDGRGVGGALIYAADAAARREELEMQRFRDPAVTAPSAVTAPDGSFNLCGLAPGSVRVWARAPGRIPAYTPPVEVRPGWETLGVEISLPLIGNENRIAGRVVDPAGSGVPFARLQYWITVRSLGFRLGDEKRAEANGSFEFVLHADSVLSMTAFDPQGMLECASAEKVRPGSEDLELCLTGGCQVRLLAFSADRRPIARFRFQVLSPDEKTVLQEGRGGEENPGEARYGSPAGGYLVRLIAPLHQIATLGPFQAGQVGDSLEAFLAPLPGLHGTVVSGSASVPDARVLLFRLLDENESITANGFPCLREPFPVEETDTDGEGRFVLTPREARQFVVRAEKDGYAPAEYGPAAIDPLAPGEQVELRLGLGGCLEGRVIGLMGQDPAGTVVGVHRGDGRPQTVRVGSDGAFRFDRLVPGWWCVETRSEEVFETATTTRSHPGEPQDSFQWNCEVFEGKTSRCDVDLEDPNACRLEGTIAQDGEPLRGWTAWLCPTDVPFFDNSGRWPAASISADGTFNLYASKPGRYRLVIKDAAPESDRIISQEVFLGGSITPWRSDLATGVVVIKGLGVVDRSADVPDLVFSSEGAVWFLSLVVPDAQGVCRLDSVPVGDGRLLHFNPASLDPADWPVAARVEIRRGEEAVIEAP